MSERSSILSPRVRRQGMMVFAIAMLSVAGLWLWNQRSTGQPPQRMLAIQVTNAEEAEHKHTNKLIHETSPYLLQHAHNPVNWYPWGEEAFEKARSEDKPVFLSVGYSTCYWCHVMEKESFENPEVAKILNDNFIAIKVDREERPDIDKQYMLATQLMTRRGGWPNSVWLTSRGKPWMAGTYFPKPQFMAALNQLAKIWKTGRADVERQADALVAAIDQIGGNTAAVQRGELTPQLVDQAVGNLVANFDPHQGGFGGAPKFPPHGTLRLLIRQYRDTGSQTLLEPITKTLDAMWLGGMHDHIGGGFHRYSTDAQWLLPHFEKMLYDNAQLMWAYTDGYLITGNEQYRQAVEDIFRWVKRDMTSPQGAFYSAMDSGEVGKEGEIYLWHIDEVKGVLGPQDAELFTDVYSFKKQGNFTEEAAGERPGTNIPHLDQQIEVIAKARGENPVAFADRLVSMRHKLLAHRQTWVQPHKDDKVLTSWNGLMIASLAYAGRQFNEPHYTRAAVAAAGFILDRMMRDDTLLRTYRAREAKQPGYLDDYAYFAQGLVELYRATTDDRWLNQADQLAQKLLEDFQDKLNGGFYFTTICHEDLLMRSKSLSGDGNLPGANGITAQVLFQLAQLTDDPRYVVAATRALESMVGMMRQNPYGSEDLVVAVAQRLRDENLVQLAAKGSSSNRRSATQPASATDTVAGDAAVTSPDARKRVGPVTIAAYTSRLSVKPGGSLELAVAMDIDEGWHLYAQNPKADFLVPSTVSVDGGESLAAGKVQTPQSHRMVDSILKQPLNTYTGRIWFRVPVTVDADAQAGATTLKIAVKTQACDAGRCLIPQTTTPRLHV